MERYIGLDIGGTKCAYSIGLVDGIKVDIIKRIEVKTLEDPIQTLTPFINEALMEDDSIKVGISCGGPLDSKKGIIVSTPNLNPKWHNFNIVKWVKDNFHKDAKLENDANACAYAEYLVGAGVGTTNMIFLTFGTGIGAGLILDKKLYSGTNSNAGEVGHIRLEKDGPVGYNKNGSFEGFSSGAGIKKLAALMAKEKNIKDYPNYSTRELASLAHDGDEFAISVFNKSGEMLGRGLSILIDILNPELIVLGGVFMRSSDLLVPSMEKVLKEETLSYSLDVCKIVPAKLSENIGDVAAVLTAKRED